MDTDLSRRSACARPVLSLDSIPSHLKCQACLELLVNCFQTPHGCRLCERCVSDKLHQTERRLCPCTRAYDCMSENVINELLVRQTCCFPDMATRRDLSDLMVHCPKSEAGCQTQMKWKYVDQHLSLECDHETAICDLCSEEIVQHKMHSSHKSLQSGDCCRNFRATCPLCGDAGKCLNREEFAEHQKSCPSGQAPCKYANSGCAEVMPRSHLTEHYIRRTDEHLELTVRRHQHELNRLLVQLQGVQSRWDCAEATWMKATDQLHARVCHLENELNTQRRAAEQSSLTPCNTSRLSPLLLTEVPSNRPSSPDPIAKICTANNQPVMEPRLLLSRIAAMEEAMKAQAVQIDSLSSRMQSLESSSSETVHTETAKRPGEQAMPKSARVRSYSENRLECSGTIGSRIALAQISRRNVLPEVLEQEQPMLHCDRRRRRTCSESGTDQISVASRGQK